MLLLLLAVTSLQLDQPLQALSSVAREGEGNEAATAAWTQIVQAGPPALAGVLEATGKGSTVADNWLRLAGDAIVEQALKARQPLPLDEVEAFIKDASHAGPARQLAFDLLQRADRARAAALEPSLLRDPVQELRRGAVQRLLDEAKGQPPEKTKAIYLAAFQEVRDEDQTNFLAAELKKMGEPVDLPSHFGFLTKWQVIGPFPNIALAGFNEVFPPEKEINLEAEYDGKEGKVKWLPFESKHEYGKIDFNKPLGMKKEATAYAFTTFDSPEERDAELRLGGKNAWKIWVNGQFLFGRDEYHRGQQMDQYRLKCHLKKGQNTVLVKCCQNEMKETWTVEWEFQLRVCDTAGTALISAAGSADAGQSKAAE